MESVFDGVKLELLGGLVAGFFALAMIYVTTISLLLKRHVDRVMSRIEKLLEEQGKHE